MRDRLAAGLLLLALATTSCQPAPPPSPTPSAAPSSTTAVSSSTAAAQSPAAIAGVPDIAWVSLGDTSSEIVFLSSGRPTPFAAAGNSATDPAFSPDGKSVAFVQVDPGRKFRIVRTRLDGTEPKTLLETTDMVFTPSWSPDGKKLAYTRRQEEDFSLCTIASDGGDAEVVPAKTAQGPLQGSVAPCWAKDGKSLYVTARDDGKLGIFRVDAGSGQAKLLGTGFAPQLSPDGQSMTYIDLVGGIPELRISRPDLSGSHKLDVSMPMAARWSPDGKRFFYNTIAAKGNVYELWSADANGGGATRMAEAGNAVLSSTAIMLPSIARAMSKPGGAPAPKIQVEEE